MGNKSSLRHPGTGQAITVWIEADTVPRLEALAAQQGVSRSTLTRRAIFNFLNASNGDTPAA